MISETNTAEEAAIRLRLDAIGRPSGWAAGPSYLNAWQRLAKAMQERKAWGLAHPELEREHHELVAQLSALVEAGEEERRQEANQERVTEDLGAAGLGKRDIRVLGSDFASTAAVDAVMEFLAEPENFLLLTGGPGTGKSVAGSLAVQRTLAKRKSALFVRAPEAATRQLYGDEAIAWVARLRKVSMLVIDDLGAEILGSGWATTFCDIIDARYRNLLPTILTTNLDVAALKARYDDRFSSRIRHDCRIIACGNESLRTRPAPTLPGLQ